MNTLQFSISISAPKETVWETLWSDEGYGKWTAAFMEGSYAKTDWKEGSKILFLTPDGDGMFSIIDKNRPHHEMTFNHQGEVKKGVEEPKSWAGAKESYHLQEADGKTDLTVFVDASGEFEEYAKKTFPKALELVKQLSEK